MTRHALIASLVLLLAAPAMPASAQTKPAALRTYETKYYVIHTNLGRDAAREAELRLTRMAEEYHRRTRGFAGEIREKFAFYLFKSESDYHAAGGTPGSAGEYDPNTQTLRTFTGGDQANLVTWYTVQHEGFHQFADQVIGGGMPIAINEGLAEYFGEALFTGDAFVAGVVPPWRLKRVRASLEEKKFVPLPELLALSHKEWNARLGTTNYDHAWTLVHFLVEGGRQVALENFIRDTAAGASWQAACEKHLGRVEDIESAWRSYWTKLPDDAAGELYAQATMRTLTSFLARATLRRQRFDSFEGFVSAAKQGELKSAESDWLPPSLLNDALARVAAMQKDGGLFALSSRAPRPPHLLYEDKDGRQMAGKFTLKGSRVERYEVGFVAHSLGSGRRPATKASP